MTAAIATSTLAVPAPVSAEARALLNVVIIDDERAVREMFREAVSSLGYLAGAVDSAEQGLRVLESQTVDVVFLDLPLNGRGGLDLLRKLKARRPETEVIVMAGHGTVESAVEAMKSGAYDYLMKPFSLEQVKVLLDRISIHLRLKTENRACGRRSNLSRASAKLSAARRKWTSYTALSPRRRTAHIRC